MIDQLQTEQRNKKTEQIDNLSTLDVLKVMNEEDTTVAHVVASQLETISLLVDQVVAALQHGGRLFYIGAGTSGRLGILDASECPPTFGVSKDLVVGVIAGGEIALCNAVEGAEDSQEDGKNDLERHRLTSKDVVVGLAASGRTPYVKGALEYAKHIGCVTGSVCCVKDGEISALSDFSIEAVVGPEVITGSTRLKSGTAQKMILNMISTASMIKLGKVYGNYMVDVMPTNLKLQQRAINMLSEITSMSKEEAKQLLDNANQDVKTAIVMFHLGVEYTEAKQLLEMEKGHIRQVLQERGH